jgi:hypothetical protein
MHIGSGTKAPQTSADAPPAAGSTIIFGNSVASVTGPRSTRSPGATRSGRSG